MSTRRSVLLALLLLASAARAEPVDVAVSLVQDRVIVDVKAVVALHRDIVWDVLTDYEHMAEFVGSLKRSSVLSRKGNRLEVEQIGEAKRGPLSFRFATVRSVELTPRQEIKSQLVRGDFKSYEFNTRLAGDSNDRVTIVHHGEYVPLRWVPPVIGPALIEEETRKQYDELIAEMHRRASVPPAR